MAALGKALLSHSSGPRLVVGIGLCLALGFGLAAQGENGSLSDLDIEVSEAKLTLQTLAEENQQLREQLKNAREAVNSLTESLAVANSEAEVFRRESREMKLRLEALGLDAANPDRAKLEQRLLKAVRDLQLLEADKTRLADQLIRLTESVLRFLQSATSVDAEARLALEAEMRGTTQVLGVGPELEPTQESGSLVDGRVMSVKEELALVVANIGSLQGVKVGMPFQVWRADTKVGTVQVVDVRDRFSGAIIQSLDRENEKIKVGDRLRVDARQF
jgi:predicted nucleotidyltransferase